MNSLTHLTAAFAALLLLASCQTQPGVSGTAALQPGDIVFQDSSPVSGQAEAIKKLTRSDWSHCGIYFEDSSGKGVVVDGNGLSKAVAWEKWRANGNGGRYAAWRAVNPLTAAQISALRKAADHLDGRIYDKRFAWDDERIYCSEIIWKAWRAAFQEELCPLQKLGDFDLASREARALIERPDSWGSLENALRHRDEPVVSPQKLTESALLRRIR
ncbi:MAG TPA: hypothetical protein DIT64_12185 [Verrucomicrobiales bacterium]|nr:hypothetical protein [Verrucomicrobiales bacterium]